MKRAHRATTAIIFVKDRVISNKASYLVIEIPDNDPNFNTSYLILAFLKCLDKNYSRPIKGQSEFRLALPYIKESDGMLMRGGLFIRIFF